VAVAQQWLDLLCIRHFSNKHISANSHCYMSGIELIEYEGQLKSSSVSCYTKNASNNITILTCQLGVFHKVALQKLHDWAKDFSLRETTSNVA
jgi:hypothetical protein